MTTTLGPYAKWSNRTLLKKMRGLIDDALRGDSTRIDAITAILKEADARAEARRAKEAEAQVPLIELIAPGLLDEWTSE